MAKSSKQNLDEVFAGLENVVPGSKEYEVVNLIGVDKYLRVSIEAFLKRANDNIIKYNLVSSGNLQDLGFTVTENNNGYTITVGYSKDNPASEYYDYVNKGVRGFKSGTPNSKYTFKSAFPNRKMAANIFSWIKKNRIRDKYEANVNKSQLGKKRAGLTKMVSEAKNKRGLAYAIATGIKKKGLKRTLFFDDAIAFAFGQDFVNGLAKILGKQITLQIGGNYGNNNQ